MVQGVPAGVEVTTETIRRELARRRHGVGRGARQQFEEDEVRILGGVRHGKTTGAPIAIEIRNTEWPKWEAVMSADPVDPEDLMKATGTGDKRELARNRKLTTPRPGHADLPGMLKYGSDDARNILERASARETAARVAVGAIAKALVRQLAGIQLVSHVVSIGEVEIPEGTPAPWPDDQQWIDVDPVRCVDADTSAAMVDHIENARSQADTLGGVVEVLAYGMVPGLGSFMSADERLDARLAGEIMSIQAVKGVEIGDGFRSARRRGSWAHDEIVHVPGVGIARQTNRAGGIEGGMSNGEVIKVRAAMKPISTVPRALETIDLDKNEPARAFHQRSDVCAVVPLTVICEAVTALVIARALLEKTGGDSLKECSRNLEAYRMEILERLL